jgi:hypothetical protein
MNPAKWTDFIDSMVSTLRYEIFARYSAWATPATFLRSVHPPQPRYHRVPPEPWRGRRGCLRAPGAAADHGAVRHGEMGSERRFAGRGKTQIFHWTDTDVGCKSVRASHWREKTRAERTLSANVFHQTGIHECALR